MNRPPQPVLDADALARQIEPLRPTLLRLARLQLRNEAWAEDAVSETVLAALQGAAGFRGGAQVKTWIIGILKHKLLDQLRLHARETTVAADDDDGEALDGELYRRDGHFRELPEKWADPCSELQREQFFAVLEACMERLPGRQGRVFLMREWLEIDSAAICQELAIAPTNLWILLHRARLRLRECLQLNWFVAASR